ncbi:MAG: hydantoinase B/oxoprolinase family protein [Gammaproteobacteria bacterium]
MIDSTRRTPAQSVPAARLRDLAGRAFEERYDCDRFTATVLTNRFGFIIEHLVSRILTTAFSAIVRTGSDFAVCLLGPPELRFPMVAVSNTIPVFTGSLPDAVRISLEEYGLDKLRPSDVIAVNDYYRVGTHLNDTCFIRPIFHQGKIIAVITIRAHMMDMGGTTAGGFRLTKQTTFEDGLRLPPTLLFSQGEPVASAFRLIFTNTRFGPMVFPDIQSIRSSLVMADDHVQETIGRYGAAAFLGAVRYACDASAETMSDALRAIPDGIYEGEETLDSDGLPDSPEYRVKVRIHKVGERVEFDWSGSSCASRSALNAAWLDVKTAITVGLKCLIEPHSRLTSGTLRNVDIVVPPDAILNPAPTHPCQFYYEVVISMMMAMFRVLMPVLGERGFGPEAIPTLNFVSGASESGVPWMTFGPGAAHSPWGASQYGDGDRSQTSLLFNAIMTGVEDSEREGFYAIALSSEILPDSGGAGTHRGGPASVNDTYWLQPGTHVCVHFHVERPPGGGGAAGGRAGLLGGAWCWGPSDAFVDARSPIPISLEHPMYRTARPMLGVIDRETGCLDEKGVMTPCGTGLAVPAGSVVRVVTNGAGGWGDPFERDPVRVLHDVRDEYVSIAGAARDYGVVVLGDPRTDPESLAIDHGATAILRSRQRIS